MLLGHLLVKPLFEYEVSPPRLPCAEEAQGTGVMTRHGGLQCLRSQSYSLSGGWSFTTDFLETTVQNRVIAAVLPLSPRSTELDI